MLKMCKECPSNFMLEYLVFMDFAGSKPYEA